MAELIFKNPEDIQKWLEGTGLVMRARTLADATRRASLCPVIAGTATQCPAVVRATLVGAMQSQQPVEFTPSIGARDQFLDLAMIGSMWRGTANRIDGLVADHKVDVGAIRTERIIAWQAQSRACLPPSMLRPDYAIGEARDQAGARSHSSLWCHDGDPVAIVDPA